jgi:putative transposase
MDNHFHTLVRSPGSLSDAMHRLGCEYARWYNNEHGRDGPLFRNRFISIPVTSEEQLLVASRYIHRNPLAFVPLEALPAYRWSSLGVYLGHREAPDWLHLDVVGPLLGDIDAHRTFVQQAHPSDNDHSLWHSMRRPVDLTEIERAVSNVTHLEPKSFVGARRGEPLALVLMLAVELRAAPAERLAQQYGIPSAAAVRAAARRGRVRLVDDPNFAQLRGHVMSALFGAAA